MPRSTVKFTDSEKALFGAGDDLEIYHDGSNSYVDDAGTGRLYLRGNDRVQIQKYTGEDMFTAIADGATKLYYDNANKLETTNTGVTVTGNIVVASGSGIDFSATSDSSGSMSSELLDDYEEGTWTPTSPTVTLTSPSGRYTKIGREVLFEAHFTFPSTSSSVQALIDGLPFTAAATTFGSSYLRYTDFGTYTFFSISGSGNRIYAYNLSGASVTLATVSTKRFDISGRYFV